MTTKQKQTLSESFQRAEWKRMIQAQARAEMRRHYGTLELLTTSLINELVRCGWQLDELHHAARLGYFYSRKLNKLTDDYRAARSARLSDVA